MPTITQPKTVNDIITRAFFLANSYAEGEMPSGNEIQEGLYYINELLDNLSGSGIYIPYVNSLDFYTKPTQPIYLFSRLTGSDVNTDKIIQIFDMYLHYYGMRLPMAPLDHDEAYQLPRVESAYTRPSQFFLQNQINQSQITLFYTPDTTYQITMRVKQVLSNLFLQQELSTIPTYYHRFLRYALAKELANVYETDNWNENKEKEYLRMKTELEGASDVDYSVNISSALLRRYKGTGFGREIIMAGT